MPDNFPVAAERTWNIIPSRGVLAVREKRESPWGAMRRLIRKFLLGTGSVLALGIAGNIASSALNDVADAADLATAASTPAVVETSRDALTGDALRRDDIRWAQMELRYRGFYQGSLDGIVGPETKRALSQFQKINGLGPSDSLNAQTWEVLTGSGIPAIAEGSQDARPYGN
jgi:Putative peptidoglycan binding domain